MLKIVLNARVGFDAEDLVYPELSQGLLLPHEKPGKAMYESLP
jgi:hypothetical protein